MNHNLTDIKLQTTLSSIHLICPIHASPSDMPCPVVCFPSYMIGHVLVLTLSLSLSRSLSLVLSLSISHSLTLTHTLSHSHTLTLSHTHTHSHSLTLTLSSSPYLTPTSSKTPQLDNKITLRTSLARADWPMCLFFFTHVHKRGNRTTAHLCARPCSHPMSSRIFCLLACPYVCSSIHPFVRSFIKYQME